MPTSGGAGLGPIRPFGDSALVIDTDSVGHAHALARALAAPATAPDAGIEDVVVGYRSVTVVANPTLTDLGELRDRLGALVVREQPAGPARRVEIPVAFDGPDLEEVAALSGLTPDAVVGMLCDTELQVAFLGFLPGFAYLDGLPAPLRALERRSTPRTAVPAGSIGLAGGFAALYPRRSPGGWHLVGRSGVALFDPDTPPYATLQPGDVVRFVQVEDPGEPSDPSRPLLDSAAERTVTVIEPGILSTVQDLGRRGVARLGVPRAGAADPYALRIANRVVGNDEGAAGIEITVRGPSLRFGVDAHLTVAGEAEAVVDHRPVPCDTVVPVSAGQVVSVGEILGDLRCYLAVAGGVDVPAVLGSRSSDLLSGLGPGPLRPGDRIGLAPPGRPRGGLAPDALRVVRSEVRPGPDGRSHVGRVERAVRVLAGPDDFDDATMARLTSGAWEVTPDSDRVGVRLTGPEPLTPPSPGIASRGMVTGALQVPTSGWPVALGCDHATVGGYPVAACIVSADVGVLGRCRPGDLVRFVLVDLGEACAARDTIERAVARAAVGWYPVTTA